MEIYIYNKENKGWQKTEGGRIQGDRDQEWWRLEGGGESEMAEHRQSHRWALELII